MGNGLRDVLLAGLGCEATDSIRPIGNMPKDDFEAVVASLKPTADGAPTPFMVSSWKLFGRLSRLAVGAEYPEETGKPPAEDRAFLFHCFSAVEPSIEQVTAIQHLLKSSAPPYADFSVFGPHSTCMRKRMKLGGLLLAADGSLQKGELFGPSSFADWSKSYKVLATILLMLEQVWPEELDGYHELIKEYACRYGSKGWLTVYQADVRCRQEKMQIIRRRGVELWNTDQAAATRAGFNPDFPWRYVWSNAVLDASFWLREVQEKCILLITKSTSQDTVLEGDVLISGVGGSLPSQIGGGHPLSRDRSPRRNTTPPPEQSRKGQDKGSKRGDERGRQHNIGADGLFTTNRVGRELCLTFRRGECQQSVRGSCPNRLDLVHQCAKCLDQRHGATHPTACTAVAKPPQKGRGGGKGRGRGEILITRAGGAGGPPPARVTLPAVPPGACTEGSVNAAFETWWNADQATVTHTGFNPDFPYVWSDSRLDAPSGSTRFRRRASC